MLLTSRVIGPSGQFFLEKKYFSFRGYFFFATLVHQTRRSELHSSVTAPNPELLNDSINFIGVTFFGWPWTLSTPTKHESMIHWNGNHEYKPGIIELKLIKDKKYVIIKKSSLNGSSSSFICSANSGPRFRCVALSIDLTAYLAVPLAVLDSSTLTKNSSDWDFDLRPRRSHLKFANFYRWPKLQELWVFLE